MHGELAQLIAVAAHGSAWLAGRLGTDPPELQAGNSTFQYVRSVRFELPGRFLRSATVSSSVRDWLLESQRRGARRMLLAPVVQPPPDRMMLGLAGTFPAAIVASSADRPMETWRSTWRAADHEAEDRRFWQVLYRGARGAEPVPSPNIVEATDRLTLATEAAATFAREHGMDEWAAVFEAAVKLEQAADPVPPYHPDMFPASSFGRAPRRLLAMATRAWVVGGMGSWNDLAFDGEAGRDYARVSEDLLAALLQAFAAAVNGPLER